MFHKAAIVASLIKFRANVNAFSAKGYTLSHLFEIPMNIFHSTTEQIKEIIRKNSNPQLKTKSSPFLTANQLNLLYDRTVSSRTFSESIKNQRHFEEKTRDCSTPAC